MTPAPSERLAPLTQSEWEDLSWRARRLLYNQTHRKYREALSRAETAEADLAAEKGRSTLIAEQRREMAKERDALKADLAKAVESVENFRHLYVECGNEKDAAESALAKLRARVEPFMKLVEFHESIKALAAGADGVSTTAGTPTQNPVAKTEGVGAGPAKPARDEPCPPQCLDCPRVAETIRLTPTTDASGAVCGIVVDAVCWRHWRRPSGGRK